MTGKNIFQRINDVMGKIDYIQKDKSVTGVGVSYKAVTHDNVVAQVRQHVMKAGIVIYPEQLKSEVLVKRDVAANIKMMLYSGDYAVHFVNTDNPEDRLTTTINAHANDNGDKAPGKAASYAVKTAILKVFLIETGENDESRVEHSKPITDLQVKAIKNLITSSEADTEKLCEFYEVESIDAITKDQYDKVVAQLKSKIKKDAK